MKKIALRLICCLLACCTSYSPARAQADEIQQLVLNYQKLAQLKKILQNMYQGYEILSKGYNTVKGLSEGNFQVHDVFLSGLLQISPAVRKYKRIADIIEDQAAIVKEYKSALRRFRENPVFTEEELQYFARVYESLFQESIKNIDALTLVVTANKLRMSDDERIREIDRIYTDTVDKLSFLRHFNGNVAMLSLQRAKDQQDIHTTRKLYGIQK